MAKKTNDPYDPNNKESWHLAFEEEPVNDDFWSCIVTAAVPVEPSEEECIDIFNQMAQNGARRAIRALNMADVIKVLKLKDKKTKEKEKGKEKGKDVTKLLEPPVARPNEVITFASKYATIKDGECRLPPDLMAAVLKYLILNIKDEDCFKRRLNNAKNKKYKEMEVKNDFVSNILKGEEGSRRGSDYTCDRYPKISDGNDEPVGGPEMYILLSGFYNPVYFLELNRLKVNFLALIRVESFRRLSFQEDKEEKVVPIEEKKKKPYFDFWQRIESELNFDRETTTLYKDIAMLKYNAPNLETFESKDFARNTIYDDISQIQYCTFFIYKHYQNFLQHLRVHPMVESLEILDLSKCSIYNKLCDYFLPEDRGDEFLILYAMIEQVVAGVPETANRKIEYSLPPTDFFREESDDPEKKTCEDDGIVLVPPCKKCRKKCCPKHEILSTSPTFPIPKEQLVPESVTSSAKSSTQEEKYFSVSFIDDIKRRKEADEVQRSPKIFNYDDYTSIRCLGFDTRIIDASSVVKRFLFDSMIPKLWTKYPKLPEGDRTYYDYQFYRLQEISDETRELLRLKVHFTIVMNMIAFTASSVHKGDDENVSQMWEVSSARLSRFSLPPFFLEDKFRRSSGESMRYQTSKTDFWRMFFKKVYNFPFSEEPKPKSIKIGLGLGRDAREDSMVKKVASTSNIFRPCVAPFSGRFSDSKDFGASATKKPSGEEAFEEDVDQLWKMFECIDIVSLEDPTFLTDFQIFEDFAKHFNVYEELNPKEMVQRLQTASDNYNMVQFNYFPPTDSIVLLMYNDCDYRGVYFDHDYGFLTSPLCLRDFYSFVFFEIKDWLRQEDKKYNEYVTETREKEKNLEKRKKEELYQKIKKEFFLMNQEEKEKFLGIIKDPVKSKKGEEKTKENAEPALKEEDLENLPKREKPKKPNVKSFDVINADQIRTQINSKTIQFHSRDGSSVNIVILTWLYDRRRLLRLKIKRSQAELDYHYDINRASEKDFHILTKSGIRIAFFKKPGTHSFHYFMKVVWPSGLIVETKLGPNLYIKQSYLGDLISKERSRCFIKEGKVLIFRKNGNVDILCPDATKYGCYEFEKPGKMEPPEQHREGLNKSCECKITKKEKKKKAEGLEKELQAKIPVASSLENESKGISQILITDYDIVTPTGEFYAKTSRPKCFKGKRLINALKVLIGEDELHEEIFFRREDGTNCTIWSDGKMVTTYPDGTKITTIPEIEEEEIATEWTEEEKQHYLQLDAERALQRRSPSQPRDGSLRSILRNPSQERSKSSVASVFDPKDPKSFRTESFVSVKSSYLLEHPKYSTVFYPWRTNVTKILMPDLDIQLRPDGTYTLQVENEAKIEVKENSVEFYAECNKCDKKSSSEIDFDSKSILCKTVDYFDRIFLLYQNGETVVDCEAETSEKNQGCFDSDFKSESVSAGGEFRGEEFVRTCDHDQPISSKQKLFVLERDLSGIEFLHDDVFTKIIEKNSVQNNSTAGKDDCRHFFEPLSKANRDNWTMSYQYEDSLPINLKRKDLRLLGSQTENLNVYRYPFPRKPSQNKSVSSSISNKIPYSEEPNAIAVRVIKMLNPGPVKILKKVVSLIKSYQNRSKEMHRIYREHSVPDETPDDERYIKMRLKKIALTLNQSLKFFDHSGIITPSTDADLHYFAHKRLLNQYLNQENNDQENTECYQEINLLPKCKFINCNLPAVKRDSYISEIMEHSG